MQIKHILALVTITLLSILLQPHAAFADPVWILQVADSTTTEPAFTSIALDSNDYPHIAYTSGGTHRLMYTRWNGTNWDVPTVVDNSTADIGWFTSIAIDSNDYPHISYYDAVNTSLKHAYYDGSWHTETVDDSGDCGQYGTSIALDGSNRSHISYMDRSSEDLKYAYWDGDEWIIAAVDSDDAVGYYSSLAFDSSYYPHISYIDKTNNKLKYAHWTGSTWQLQSLHNVNATSIQEMPYGRHTSIALDISENPHICYYKPSGIWYTRYNGTSWSEEQVSESGMYNRLALDNLNLPHISYQSGNGQNLQYARFDGTSWVIESIDSSSVTSRYGGRFAAITLDSNGWSHISYQYYQGDLATGRYVLKYARYDGHLSTVYVNGTTGNNGYDGSSPTRGSGTIGPKKTIHGAMDIVNPGGTIYVAAGTYNEDIYIGDNLTIIGAGAQTTIVSHYPVDCKESVIGVYTGGQPIHPTVTISGFTIQNGYFHGLDYGSGAGISVSDNCTAYLTACVITNNDALENGGGIYNKGTLHLTDCTIANNIAGNGGGVYNESTLYMDRCCVSSNTAQYNGGGIYNDNGQVWLTNCTISGNTVLETDFSAGGGINNISGTITVLNCTIAYNSVVPGLGKGGGFADQSFTTMTFKNTIVAYNTASQNNNGYFYPAGSVTSLGNNIDSENSCGFDQPTDQINTDPLLGPLQNNGGQTSTHAIPASSPAFNNGTNTGAPATDQRGVARPQGTTCDIGAFELIYAVSTATGTGTTTFTTSAGALNSLAASASTPCGSLAGFSFPHGFFSFTISGLVPGSTITITITLPSNVPTNTQYWKCQNGSWINCTSLISDNDGDNILIMSITDGGLGDADGLANGTIIDPGGPVIPIPVVPAQTPKPKPFGDSSSYLPERIVTSPARVSVKYLNVQPQQALANQPITIYASICNGGDEAGTYAATLKINGQVEEIRKGTVGSHNGIPLTLEVYRSDPGTYVVDINGQQSYFTVMEERSNKDSSRNNFRTLLIICIAGIIIFSTLLIYGLRIKH